MAWVKYFLIEENWCSGFPDAIVGADEKKDADLLKFLKKHEIDYGYKCDKKIPSFIFNGVSWYCHEKSAKQVARKFKITEVHTDKEQLKEQKIKEKELAAFMKTDQYLKEKLFKDANTIVGQKKRNEFVNTLKQMNQDLPRSKVTRRILDMFDEGSLVISDQSIVEKGPKFPVVKLDA
tara:strand:+ start:2480 stop:3013 length:534 start_codon:yes stop_codon:yes gene_type:complete